MTNRPNIDEIEARAEAATPGPWVVAPKNDTTDFLLAAVGPFNVEGLHSTRAGDRAEDIDDAMLMAASRSDVPALCRYVRELEAELAVLRRWKAGVEQAKIKQRRDAALARKAQAARRAARPGGA